MSCLLPKPFKVCCLLFISIYYIKKDDHQRTDAFKLPWWRRVLRVPWTARTSNQSILKEINPEYSLEELMLKLKVQYFGHLILIGKDPDAGKDWEQEEKQVTEDEMVGWHHWQMEMSLSELQEMLKGNLECCSPWGCRVGHNLAYGIFFSLKNSWCLHQIRKDSKYLRKKHLLSI